MTLGLPQLLEEFRHPEGAGPGLPLVLATGGSALLVVPLVYLTGGTHLVYAHAAYLPIILAGIALGPLASAALGLLLGLALGPWMPLDTASQTYQSAQNWGLRCLFFVLIGAVTGLLAGRLRREAEERIRLQTLNPTSHLPGRAALERRVSELQLSETQPPAWCLVILRFNTLAHLVEALGSAQIQLLWGRIVERVEQGRPDGGEAFHIHTDQIALLVPQSVEQATETAYGLVALLHPPVPAGDIPLELDATAGVTSLHGGTPAAGGDLAPVLTASLAAGQAHRLGQPVHLRPPEAALELQHRLRRLGELPQAIAERELELHYQPKVALASGRVVGAEALLRWRHPREGLLLPGSFLPLAEQTRLIAPLTWHSLEIAAATAVAWRAEGRRLELAVNLSVRTLAAPDVAQRLEALLQQHGLPPEALEIEVTESAIMDAPEEAAARLREIAALGVGVAIDDFGAGQSSLAYIARLPASTLKVDRALIRSLADSERARRVLAAIAELGAALGMATVAEGVEDERTLDYVRRAGLTQMQGFLVARPAAEADFLPWLDATPRPLPPVS